VGTTHLEYVAAQNWTGIDKSIMDAIAHNAGFNYTIQFYRPPLANETWTDVGMLGMRDCDVFLGDWKQTTSRLQQGLVFTDQVGSDNTVIVASNRLGNPPSSDAQDEFWNTGLVIFQPFDTSLWLVVFACVLVSALALYVVEWDGPDFEAAETWLGGLCISLYLSFTLITGVGAHNPLTFVGRALLSAYSVLMLFVISWCAMRGHLSRARHAINHAPHSLILIIHPCFLTASSVSVLSGTLPTWRAAWLPPARNPSPCGSHRRSFLQT
jgi:hypothetical protein